MNIQKVAMWTEEERGIPGGSFPVVFLAGKKLYTDARLQLGWRFWEGGHFTFSGMLTWSHIND
jgi:hypothetical protein